jgi:hypothetical protein
MLNKNPTLRDGKEASQADVSTEISDDIVPRNSRGVFGTPLNLLPISIECPYQLTLEAKPNTLYVIQDQ